MKKEVIIGPLIIFAVWYITVKLKLLSTLLLPSPFAVAVALIEEFIKGNIYLHLFHTIYRTLLGLVIGAILGVSIGMVIGYYKKVYLVMEAVIDFLRSLPAFALIPLFMLFFGLTEKAKIGLSAWAVSFVVLINTAYGVANVKQARIALAQILKMNTWQLITKIIVFDAMPNVVAGLRTGISFSLVVTVVAEMLMGAKFGLGKYVFEASLMYRMPEMYTGIFLIGLLGYVFNKLFILIENRFFHWRGK
jgi:NitT/TauT family transport system permease protein